MNKDPFMSPSYKPNENTKNEIENDFQAVGLNIIEFNARRYLSENDLCLPLIQQIVTELKSGVNPESVISHSGIEWTTTEKVKRDDMFINRAILRSVFGAGKPNSDEPIITSQRLGSGDYAIIVILNANDETLEVDEEQKKSTDLRLRRTLSTNEWQDLLRDARNNTDIRIFNENI